MIYFDNSATTYPKPKEVYDALDYANRNLAFNSGRGIYKQSNEVAEMILETRKKIASFVNADFNKVVFTSSATESLNLIINGIEFDDGDYIYITPFEHNAIVRPLYNIKKAKNVEIIILPFDKETWLPDFQKINEMFSINKPKAVFVSQVSNVTGFELDYIGIFETAKQYGAITVLDSAQIFGIKNPEMENCDFCVFAGHKSLYASFGIAGFIFSGNYDLSIVKSGGNGSDSLNHEMPANGYSKFESGSPNSVAIYGLNVSCEWIKNHHVLEHEIELTHYLLDSISKLNKVKLYLPKDKNVLGIVSFSVEGYLSDDVSSILCEEFDILVRSGYHCSPFVHQFIQSEESKGTVRISIGAFNTREEIDLLINALGTL